MATNEPLPDKWQVVRNSSNGKPKKPEPMKAVFRPVPISKTTFEDLNDENSENLSDDDRFQYPGDSGKKKPTLAKNGKKPGSGKNAAPEPKVTPDIITMDCAKLAGSIAICRERFPGNDLLLLQEVANFLRMDANFAAAIKLCPSSTSPSNSCEEFGFPLKHLTPKQLAELRTVVGSVQTDDAFCRFIDYAVEEMLTAFTKGDSLLSHRLCLQLISLERPESFLQLAEKYAGVLKNSKFNQNKVLAIMATFAQAGLGSLSVGLNVWFTVMLPTIQLPNLNHITLQYGEKLLNAYNVLNDFQLPPSSAPQTLEPAFKLLTQALQSCQPYNPPPNYELFAREISVSPLQFFRLFDMVHPISASGKASQGAPWMSRLTASQKRQLANLCFKIKVLLMKYGCDCCPATMLPSFLVRFNEHLPVFIKKEVLSSLLVCFHCDQSGCSEAWLGSCNRYTENAGLLSSSVAENLPMIGEYVTDLSQLKKTMKKVDSLVAAGGKSNQRGSSGVGGICWRAFATTFRIIRNVSTLLILALLADFFLNNCDSKQMSSVKLLHQYNLYKPLTKSLNQAQTHINKVVDKLYPTAAHMFSYLAPISVKMGETFVTCYEASSKFLAPYIKSARSNGSQFYAQSAIYAEQANVWLVKQGVDFKAVGNWVAKTAYPAVAQHLQNGSVALSEFFNKNVLPWVRQIGGSLTSRPTSQGL